MSFLENLQCSDCSTIYDPDKIQTFCPICQSPLLANYQIDKAREHVDRDIVRHRPPGMWRWQEMLPVKDP
jgi:threonine synthase